MKKTSVYLRKRKLKNGTTALFMDIYGGTSANVCEETGKLEYKQIRYKKGLGLSIISKPRNAVERRQNEEILRQAKEICKQEELGLASVKVFGKEDIIMSETDFYEFFQDYINIYTKKDLRQVKRAYTQFKNYIASIKRYKTYVKRLEFNALTKTMIEGYASYLKTKFSGEGPHSVFARFKKVVRRAVEEGFISKNPCDGIVIKVNTGQLKKDTLTPDEIKTLLNTHYPGENAVIKRAFIFSLFTGIRWCDIRALQFKNVHKDDKILAFEQIKTEGCSNASFVTQPMSELHMALIGKPETNDERELIFKLPTDTTCNKHLKKWVKAAGINKHITWHCARHSFGTNMCEQGVDIVTIMNLMGHSSLKYTNIYIRVRDRKKVDAMENLCGDFNLCDTI